MRKPAKTVGYVANDDEKAADKRWTAYKDVDPFPDMDPGLLSSEHIQDYVRHTAMLHPFEPKSERLKGASYELKPGRKLIFWNESGERIDKDVRPDGVYTLRANSITFLQVDGRFRLPNYIAARFNLRIKHVHRGLLLGTGPLIDPGFAGDLLIPVHNLTSEDYELRADEGLIWVEFTKTTRDYEAVPAKDPRFKGLDSYKIDQTPDYYLGKANGNRPIQSSIPGAIREAQQSAAIAAEQASGAKTTIESTLEKFRNLGLVAAIGLVIGLLGLFAQMYSNVMTAAGIAEEARRVAGTAANATEPLRLETMSLKLEAEKANALKDKFEASLARIESLEAEMRRLAASLPCCQQEAPLAGPSKPIEQGK